MKEDDLPLRLAGAQILDQELPLGRSGFQVFSRYGPALLIVYQGGAVQGHEVGIAVVEGVVVFGRGIGDELVEPRRVFLVVARAQIERGVVQQLPGRAEKPFLPVLVPRAAPHRVAHHQQEIRPEPADLIEERTVDPVVSVSAGLAGHGKGEGHLRGHGGLQGMLRALDHLALVAGGAHLVVIGGPGLQTFERERVDATGFITLHHLCRSFDCLKPAAQTAVQPLGLPANHPGRGRAGGFPHNRDRIPGGPLEVRPLDNAQHDYSSSFQSF